MLKTQFYRFVAVGLGLNSGLYLLYLFLCRWVTNPTLAMTICYVLGVVIGFRVNRSVTFGARTNTAHAPLRYLVSYLIGYGFNLALLRLFLGELGLSSAVGQGISILLVAGLTFLLQRYWVFGTTGTQHFAQLGRERTQRDA